MLPISELRQSEAAGLKGLLFDLDDTLLDHGRLSEKAYASLFSLQRSGLKLIALTGRPLSFADFIRRTWPVDGAIAENGAVGVHLNGKRIEIVDTVAPAERARRREQLESVRAQVQIEVPGLKLTDDAHYRLSDVTFDIGEHESPEESLVARAIAIAERSGTRTTRSSIHLHFSLDHYDKATGALRYLHSCFGLDQTESLSKFAFIGDSDNDAPAFAAFRTSVGVRNLRLRASLAPRYRTSQPSGAGFVEFAEHLLTLRQS